MNLTMLAAMGSILARLVSGDMRARPNKIYVEYENVADPEDEVSAPSIDPLDPAHGLPYYAGLSGVSGRDFLRVDILGIPLRTPSGEAYEDAFASGDGNLLQLLTQTSGTAGVHAKPFNNASHSKVCGVALVAAPVSGDYTQDVVVARGYYAAEDQILVVDGSQISIALAIPFNLPA